MPARASLGIKRPAFTWGHGGGVSPHIRSVSPASPRSLYARKGIAWDATSHVAGGVGRAAPQNKTPTSKNLCASFPKLSKLFFNVFCTFFMPVRAQFGIKRPAFTRGHGGDASPHIQRLSTNVRKSCAKRTMGVALPLPGRGGGISPHMKAFVGYFLKSSPQPLCPQGHHLGCNIPCCRGRGASSPTKQTHGISTPQGAIGD